MQGETLPLLGFWNLTKFALALILNEMKFTLPKWLKIIKNTAGKSNEGLFTIHAFKMLNKYKAFWHKDLHIFKRKDTKLEDLTVEAN